ncbi:MAG: methyl-accepting chemotaxis protein [Lachnospiraceae bacterium]|nr:methyl-accepting chemotaxis protein [Lachnospiraceae bacterium]
MDKIAKDLAKQEKIAAKAAKNAAKLEKKKAKSEAAAQKRALTKKSEKKAVKKAEKVSSSKSTQTIKKKKKRTLLSINTKLSVVIIASILITILVSYNYLTKISKQTLIDNTYESLGEIVNAQSSYIDQSIEKYNATLTYLDNSENLFIYNASGRFSNEVHATFDKYMKMNPSHENIGFVSVDSLSLIGSSVAEKEGTDYSAENFVLSIVETLTPAQSNVFIDEATGEAMISIGVPEHTHFSDEEISGVLFTTIKASLLSDTISTIKLFDSETSYASLTDSRGVYIYHPDASKIGTVADSALVTNIVSQIDAGTIPETTVAESGDQFVAYKVSPMNNWILQVMVDKDVVLASIDEMGQSAVKISIILMAVMTVIAFFFTTTITKPLKVITKIINKTADLDISHDESYHYLLKKKDETGSMSRAVQRMRQSFSGMMKDISSTSESLGETSSKLHTIATAVNDNATNSAATAQQLSASMHETATNTENIRNEIVNMGVSTAAINQKASEGVSMSQEIMKHAEALRQTTIEATEKTQKLYESVKSDSEAAIIRSHAVSKINELADTIMEIADQTQLLSLNASIEAARAGDAGRGFSVVASEIGKLAEQSSKTVSSISAIVSEVNAAVNQMEHSMKAALDFLDSKVLPDYHTFANVSDQYSEDADFFNKTMTDIDHSIDELDLTMKKMTESIQMINVAVSETSDGIAAVADHSSQNVVLTTDTYSMVESTMQYADTLQQMVDNFTL